MLVRREHTQTDHSQECLELSTQLTLDCPLHCRCARPCPDSPLETEKYAHVTFFFNGGREAAFDLEDRQLVPSPKVATYDLQPEMNVAGVAEAVSATPSTNTHLLSGDYMGWGCVATAEGRGGACCSHSPTLPTSCLRW